MFDIQILHTEFYLEYFLTPKGAEELSLLFNVAPQNLNFHTVDDVAKFLYSRDYSSIPNDPEGQENSKKASEKITDISGASIKFAEAKTLKEFEESNFETIDRIKIPSRITVIRNPKELAEKIEGFRKLKNYHRQEAQRLSGIIKIDPTDQLAQAEKVLLNIHRRRLNELIAGIYPTALAFVEQFSKSENPPNEWLEYKDIVLNNLPGIKNAAQLDLESKQRSLARFDRFVEGVGELSSQGEEGKKDYSVLTQRAIELADESSDPQINEGGESFPNVEIKPEELKQRVIELADKSSNPQITNESKKSFPNVEIKPEELKQWFEKCLKEYGYLSQQKDYDADRVKPAEDNLWQVIIREDKTTLSANPKQKVVFIPAKNQLAKVIPIIDHKIGHVIQHQNKESLGLAITNRVRASSSTILAEAGSINLWEEKAEKSLFRTTRPTNPHYLRAVQRRLQGGNYAECMKAFFDSDIRQNPNKKKSKAAELAIDRAKRLFRNGGILTNTDPQLTNSDPLQYLEQALLVQNVPQELLSIGGVSIETIRQLKRIGLYNPDNIKSPEIPPHQILSYEISQKLPQKKSRNTSSPNSRL